MNQKSIITAPTLCRISGRINKLVHNTESPNHKEQEQQWERGKNAELDLFGYIALGKVQVDGLAFYLPCLADFIGSDYFAFGGNGWRLLRQQPVRSVFLH